jgi:hypothetical protein
MYDLLHLTPAGYREWAACMLPTVERLMRVGAAASDVPGERERGNKKR